MRWDDLFADMEGRLDAEEAAVRAEQVADLTRSERAAVHLADRLRAAQGVLVAATLASGERVSGTVADVATAWVTLVEGSRQHLVPLAACALVDGVPVRTAGPAGPVLRRLGIGHALRAVARDRTVVRVLAGGVQLHGRLGAVGADHVDLALVHVDSGRPSGRVVTVPFAALELVSG